MLISRCNRPMTGQWQDGRSCHTCASRQLPRVSMPSTGNEHEFDQISFAAHLLVSSKHIGNKNGLFPHKLLRYKLYGYDRENTQISNSTMPV